MSILIGQNSGCRKNEEPTSSGGNGGTLYGKGSMTFDAASAGGHFMVDGLYKPTDQFLIDSSSQGAGGFVYDTTDAGKPLRDNFKFLDVLVQLIRNALVFNVRIVAQNFDPRHQ